MSHDSHVTVPRPHLDVGVGSADVASGGEKK